MVRNEIYSKLKGYYLLQLLSWNCIVQKLFHRTFLILVSLAAAYPQVLDSTEIKENEWEVLPIITYDTDAGFGYGVKAFFLSFLEWNESFDITLFNSTKGERWYRFKFSLPDNEIRQGKAYDFAADFIVDYDKWINYSFFGVGNNSSFKNEITYTREPIDLKLFLSRGFSPVIISEIGFRYNSTSNYKIPQGSILNEDEFSAGRASLTSLLLRLRYDTRKSFNNPLSGVVFQAEIENAFQISLSKSRFFKSRFFKLEFSFQNYLEVLFPKAALANRLIFRNLVGKNIPIQYLMAIGGNQTLRGYTQDRFLDKSSVLINSEFRFPIYWRIGGIVGIDAGKVWPTLSKMDFGNWAINTVIGLRLYMDNFIARADLGYSKETIGFYFNFGHIF